ncbi:MAG: VTT domain-containing protein [Acidobacteriia bacterium]|nr:VTT domain-containing protein [Terriglobia bacterium]
MVHILRQYGHTLILVTVLAENLGLPVPSYALVLVAAALAPELHLSLGGIILVCALGALIGDGIWYVLGRQRGRPILRTLCSVSLNPDSCVSRTENIFARHGLKSLLVAKFLPGLNTVAPPLAGMLRISPLRFLLFDLGGIALWAGSALVLGRAFHSQVEWLLEWLAAFGRTGVLIVGLTVAGWLLLKWIERRRFYRLLESSRISAPELKNLLAQGDLVIVVDLRTDLTYRTDGLKIPGAIHIPPGELPARFGEIPPGRPVVMYCT